MDFHTYSGSTSGHLTLDNVEIIVGDTAAPYPDPATWEQVPMYLDGDTIYMKATVATDKDTAFWDKYVNISVGETKVPVNVPNSQLQNVSDRFNKYIWQFRY